MIEDYYLLGKGGYVFGSISLSVCLFVCGQHYSKSYERIGMKFYGGVLSSARKDWLNFGGDLGILRWVNEQEKKCVNYLNAIVTICWLLEPQMLLHQMYMFYFYWKPGTIWFRTRDICFITQIDLDTPPPPPPQSELVEKNDTEQGNQKKDQHHELLKKMTAKRGNLLKSIPKKLWYPPSNDNWRKTRFIIKK